MENRHYRDLPLAGEWASPWDDYHRLLRQAQVARARLLRKAMIACALGLRDRICAGAERLRINLCPRCC